MLGRMDERGRRITGTDVARAAGVSQSVVSLVFSGRSGTRVAATTERRVRDAAQRLGYVPNQSAAALRTGRSTTLALVVPVIAQPFFAAVLEAAEARGRALGYSLVLLGGIGDDTGPQRLLDMLRGNVLAGAIVYGPSALETRILAEARLPIVACELNGPALPTVDVDFTDGMTEAARHLVEQGHTAIGYLGTAYPHVTYELRFDAFVAALRAECIRLTAIERSPAADFDAALDAAGRLLDAAPALTAVVCDDDLLAPAVVRMASARGRRVPESLSVIGVGDLPIAKMLTPPLSTVAISAREIGEGAVDDLIAITEGATPRRRVIGTSLVIRGSTAIAPRALPNPG